MVLESSLTETTRTKRVVSKFKSERKGGCLGGKACSYGLQIHFFDVINPLAC